MLPTLPTIAYEIIRITLAYGLCRLWHIRLFGASHQNPPLSRHSGHRRSPVPVGCDRNDPKQRSPVPLATVVKAAVKFVPIVLLIEHRPACCGAAAVAAAVEPPTAVA